MITSHGSTGKLTDLPQCSHKSILCASAGTIRPIPCLWLMFFNKIKTRLFPTWLLFLDLYSWPLKTSSVHIWVPVWILPLCLGSPYQPSFLTLLLICHALGQAFPPRRGPSGLSSVMLCLASSSVSLQLLVYIFLFIFIVSFCWQRTKHLADPNICLLNERIPFP